MIGATPGTRRQLQAAATLVSAFRAAKTGDTTGVILLGAADRQQLVNQITRDNPRRGVALLVAVVAEVVDTAADLAGIDPERLWQAVTTRLAAGGQQRPAQRHADGTEPPGA